MQIQVRGVYNNFIMLTTNDVSVRELLRNYKDIAKRVQKTGKPVIVTSQKKPQVAIVSIKDVETLRQAKGQKSTQTLYKLVGIIPKGSGLPRDLSKNHDKYTWE